MWDSVPLYSWRDDQAGSVVDWDEGRNISGYFTENEKASGFLGQAAGIEFGEERH